MASSNSNEAKKGDKTNPVEIASEPDEFEVPPMTQKSPIKKRKEGPMKEAKEPKKKRAKSETQITIKSKSGKVSKFSWPESVKVIDKDDVLIIKREGPETDEE